MPVDVRWTKRYKDIIVVRDLRLKGTRERRLKVPEDVNLHHICPRQDLGGILELDRCGPNQHGAGLF